MTTIDRTSQVAALIKLQFAAQGAVARKSAPKQKKTAQSTRRNAASSTAKKEDAKNLSTTATLDGWMAQRVAGLAQDDPQRQRKVFRIFLESVLSLEFGSQLIGDSSFDLLVEKVLVQMESDPELSLLMNEATLALLETPPV